MKSRGYFIDAGKNSPRQYSTSYLGIGNILRPNSVKEKKLRIDIYLAIKKKTKYFQISTTRRKRQNYIENHET